MNPTTSTDYINEFKKDLETQSSFGDIPMAPPDAILGISAAFKEDNHKNKVNLSIGAYRDEEGKTFLLRAVEKVEKQLAEEKLNKEYLPQDGLKEFYEATRIFLLGKEDEAIKENRVASCQSISGTGALRLGLAFIKKFLPQNTIVYVSNPTWGNHNQICDHVGLKVEKYPYFDKKTKGLDFENMKDCFLNAPERSILLLHACAHNPTGVDPTEEQWLEIAKICKKKKHIPFFDSAYQGFASGDIVKDAFAVRLFSKLGFELICSQSFAKNFGLYGERIGTVHIICKNKELKESLTSQMKLIVRGMYSSPPLHGARIVSRILNDKELYSLFEEDLKKMSNRIKFMRKRLFECLMKKNTPGDWKHILNQIGMFTFTGLNTKQVERMVNHFHIYMISNGRISMAGLNESNVDYVASAIYDCVTTIQ
eukprot:gene327-6741_t